MKEALIEAGWYQFHQCTCGGTLKQKFKHPNKPNKIIRIMPRKNIWELYEGKKLIEKGVGVNTLINKLSQI